MNEPVDPATVAALKALADPVRLRILLFLLEPDADCCARTDAVCGCDFEEVLGLAQPTVSHHMKILVNASLVTAEKRGRWVYYDLNPSGLEPLRDLLERLGGARCRASGPAARSETVPA